MLLNTQLHSYNLSALVLYLAKYQCNNHQHSLTSVGLLKRQLSSPRAYPSFKSLILQLDHSSGAGRLQYICNTCKRPLLFSHANIMELRITYERIPDMMHLLFVPAQVQPSTHKQ